MVISLIRYFSDEVELRQWVAAWNSGKASDRILFEGFTLVGDEKYQDAPPTKKVLDKYFDGVQDYFCITCWNPDIEDMVAALKDCGEVDVEIFAELLLEE